MARNAIQWPPEVPDGLRGTFERLCQSYDATGYGGIWEIRKTRGGGALFLVKRVEQLGTHGTPTAAGATIGASGTESA